MSSLDNTLRPTVPQVEQDAWAPTLSAEQVGLGSSRSSPQAWRSTVLPRLIVRSGTSELVNDGRPRYEHECVLGEGGMGEVVCARDNDIARKVAIKRLHAAMQQSPAALQRFAQEIRTVGSLEHPNIVPIHDVGVDEHGNYFFVMKYLDGETLESIIDQLRRGRADYHARYSFAQRTRIFLGVLRAVAYAHEQGIIHRDLKPANIMVGNCGEVMVMDWGIAKQVRSAEPMVEDVAYPPDRVHATRVGSLLGTPAYMSPEQARGEPASARSDIYALCLLFHEFLCLEHPIPASSSLEETLQAVQEQPIPLTSGLRNPHQPPPPMDLTWFIRRGVHKDPNRRYQSVTEMIDRLELRAEGIVPIECHITFIQRVLGEFMRFVNRRPLLFTTLLAITLLALLGIGIIELAPR